MIPLTTSQLDHDPRHPEANYFEVSCDPREPTAQASDDFYHDEDDSSDWLSDDDYRPLRFE